nr:hypothetical protein BaRGS_009263 [Batillaria attramentaria]
MTPSHLELDQDENGAILAEVGPETDLSADEPTLAFLYAKSLMLNGSEDRDTVYLGRKRLDEFEQQPGFFYHYMSAATALVAGPSSMAASGLFFDTHTHYPNWHQNAGFNSTLPLFAPRAVHLQESVGVLDYGADASLNYTSRDVYKTNDWSLYPQSRLALRMAHFLSAFLQTRDPSGWDAAVEAAWDDYHKVVQQYVDARQFDQIPPPPGWMDKYPSDKVLSAEAVANVLADDRIMGSGIFFDVDRSAAGSRGHPRKQATELRTNYWTVPYYKCDGRVDEWVMTYAAPFFGPSEHPDGGQSLVFK